MISWDQYFNSLQYQEANADTEDVGEEYFDEDQLPEPSVVEPSEADYDE